MEQKQIKKILVSADSSGVTGETAHRSAEDDARDIYPDGGFCEVTIYEIPEDKLKSDWEGMHVSDILRDEDEEVGDYEIDFFDGYIQLPAPECTEGKQHKWSEDYGVEGHGGGVIIRDDCDICGLKRTRDTWGQNPCNGKQGYEITTYDQHHYDD